jgi:hypothetical protein
MNKRNGIFLKSHEKKQMILIQYSLVIILTGFGSSVVWSKELRKREKNKMQDWYMVYSSPTDGRNLMNMTVQQSGKISVHVPDHKNELKSYESTVSTATIHEIKEHLVKSNYRSIKSRTYGQPGEASFSIGEGVGQDMPKLRTFWMADQWPVSLKKLKLYLDKMIQQIIVED